jgi:hypothetical protein
MGFEKVIGLPLLRLGREPTSLRNPEQNPILGGLGVFAPSVPTFPHAPQIDDFAHAFAPLFLAEGVDRDDLRLGRRLGSFCGGFGGFCALVLRGWFY